jgi:hypothetical protein
MSEARAAERGRERNHVRSEKPDAPDGLLSGMQKASSHETFVLIDGMRSPSLCRFLLRR